MAASARPIRIVLFSLAAVLVVLAVGFFSLAERLRHVDEFTRGWVVNELSRRFSSKVDLDSLHVHVWPRMGVEGKGLTVHYHDRADVPPMIRIGQFSFNAGLIGLVRPVKHISELYVQDMVLTIPPRDHKEKNETPPAEPPDARRTPSIVVDRLVVDDTRLFFLSRKPGKDPLDFEIHDLVLSGVGAGQNFDFRGNLTNAKPKGEIFTHGKFGPFEVDHPGSSPVEGSYRFLDANLNPFPGIGGILSSTGKFTGALDEIAVDGQTDTPDFSIDPVGRGVPLHTDFSATVNGTDGDTFLHPVHAVLGKSVIIASGSVVLVRAKQGHLITLDVSAPAARLEDILSLAMKADRSPMIGTIKLSTKLTIPPSKEKVIDKLLLDGDFLADDARFSSSGIREKLQSLSRHGIGKPEDPNVGSAVSDLRGHFHLENSVITFSHLSFAVEGAEILLDGTYKVHGGELDFHGDLRMQATVSEMVTGWKSTLAKPFDPLFRKGKSGTVLPLTISGTREAPVFGVSIFHKTFKKEMGNQKQP